MAKIPCKEINVGSIILKIKMIADFSLWTALKLRLAGGKYIEQYLKNLLTESESERKSKPIIRNTTKEVKADPDLVEYVEKGSSTDDS